MPLPSTVFSQAIGPSFNITPAVDGANFALGDTPDAFQTGGFALSFVPGDTWVGSITILGLNTCPDTILQNVEPVPYPFRAHYLNGVPADLSMCPGGTVITARSDILVPASGARIGFSVACSAGSCLVLVQAVRGSTAP